MTYFPMTCDILTPGHIKCVQWLRERDEVVIGLLTDEALIGYKRNIVCYEDRAFILKSLFPDIAVVPQASLNPEANLLLFGCNQIASGDGFEPQELEAIERLGVTPVDIRLPNETSKTYSSSKIKEQLMSVI